MEQGKFIEKLLQKICSFLFIDLINKGTNAKMAIESKFCYCESPIVNPSYKKLPGL